MEDINSERPRAPSWKLVGEVCGDLSAGIAYSVYNPPLRGRPTLDTICKYLTTRSGMRRPASYPERGYGCREQRNYRCRARRHALTHLGSASVREAAIHAIIHISAYDQKIGLLPDGQIDHVVISPEGGFPEDFADSLVDGADSLKGRVSDNTLHPPPRQP